MSTPTTSLFRQGIQDHDNGIARNEVAQMAFPDPQTYGTAAYNMGMAHKEWLRGGTGRKNRIRWSTKDEKR